MFPCLLVFSFVSSCLGRRVGENLWVYIDSNITRRHSLRQKPYSGTFYKLSALLLELSHLPKQNYIFIFIYVCVCMNHTCIIVSYLIGTKQIQYIDNKQKLGGKFFQFSNECNPRLSALLMAKAHFKPFPLVDDKRNRISTQKVLQMAWCCLQMEPEALVLQVLEPPLDFSWICPQSCSHPSFSLYSLYDHQGNRIFIFNFKNMLNREWGSNMFLQRI